MILAWIIVGFVQTASGHSPPTSTQFYDKASCESARSATIDVALGSNLRCVEVKVWH